MMLKYKINIFDKKFEYIRNDDWLIVIRWLKTSEKICILYEIFILWKIYYEQSPIFARVGNYIKLLLGKLNRESFP